MVTVVDEKKRLMKTGVFRTQNDAVFFLIVRILGENQTPLGAWTLKEELEKYGINYGTATLGRYLKELDSKGMVEQRSNQGRILTEKGKKWLGELSDTIDRAQVRNEATNAMRVDNYFDLIDLVQARKAIELEAVKLAVQNATDEDLEELRSAVMAHYRRVAENGDPTEPALAFHSVLVGICHNRFLKSMLELLLFEERKIEEEMDQLLTRERGDSYVVEHDDIASAIAKRDADLAVKLMDAHMEALLSAVREQIQQFSEEP